MMEAALLLAVCFALWTMLSGRRAWLVGLALALAFNAKQSAIVLLPAALLAAGWRDRRARTQPGEDGSIRAGSPLPSNKLYRSILFDWAAALGVFVLLTAALNPVFWRQPLPALQEALDRRRILAAEQAADAARLAPEKQMDGYIERTAALLINLYIVPPAFAEYGNYARETASSETVYRSTPGHALLRGLAGGALLLGLTLLGLALSTLDYLRADPSRRRALALAWVATAATTAGLVVSSRSPGSAMSCRWSR
jgi:hypothetical protein